MSGWRKRTIMEMARKADPKANFSEPYCLANETRAWLLRFAELIRADEREKFLGILRQLHDSYSLASDPAGLRVRGDKHDTR